VAATALLFVAWWCLGCGTTEEVQEVARVGDRVLTMPRLEQEIPAGLTDSMRVEVANAVITHWIEEELLLMEAYRMGLDEDSRVARAVESYRRKLLIARLLDEEALVDSLVTKEMIESYYSEHQSEFKRGSEEVLLAYIAALEKSKVDEARRKWVRGTSFNELLQEELTLWGEDSVLVAQGELGDLNQMVFGMDAGETSETVSVGDNWAVFRVRGHFRAGSIRELSEVAPEIRARLLSENRQEARAVFLEKLKSKYPVIINEELLVQKTGGSNGGEE
jgi:hypothetical protein